MKNVLILLADGFEEIEAITSISVLRRAGFNVVTAGAPGTMLSGSRGIKINSDKKLIDIDPAEFDAVVVPGGKEGVANLKRSNKITELLQSFNEERKIIGAICHGPLLLAELNIIGDRRATIYPGNERKLSRPRDGRVIVDENLVTSQAPGTAMDFALQLVEELAGSRKVAELKERMVA